MKLVKIWETDSRKAYEFYLNIDKNETDIEAFGNNFEEFLNYLEEKRFHSKGEKLPNGYVPDTHYLLEVDGNYVGLFRLRHELNDFLYSGPGHIGYYIDKRYRKKGYATNGLKLVLNEAKKLNIDEAFLSCNIDNIASKKVMENCGAVQRDKTSSSYLMKIEIK